MKHILIIIVTVANAIALCYGEDNLPRSQQLSIVETSLPGISDAGSRLPMWQTIPTARENGATVADDFVCTVDLCEWDWHDWQRPGKPKKLNGGTFPTGGTFHLDCNITDLREPKERNLSFGEWCRYGFTPHLELRRMSETEPMQFKLKYTSSATEVDGWISYQRGKTRKQFQVPPSAFGDFESVVKALPPGDYQMNVVMDFTKGLLRSNTVEFKVGKAQPPGNSKQPSAGDALKAAPEK